MALNEKSEIKIYFVGVIWGGGSSKVLEENVANLNKAMLEMAKQNSIQTQENNEIRNENKEIIAHNKKLEEELKVSKEKELKYLKERVDLVHNKVRELVGALLCVGGSNVNSLELTERQISLLKDCIADFKSDHESEFSKKDKSESELKKIDDRIGKLTRCLDNSEEIKKSFEDSFVIKSIVFSLSSAVKDFNSENHKLCDKLGIPFKRIEDLTELEDQLRPILKKYYISPDIYGNTMTLVSYKQQVNLKI
jgi:hypothetical protein